MKKNIVSYNYKNYNLICYLNNKGKFNIPDDQQYFGLILSNMSQLVPFIGTNNEEISSEYICIDDIYISDEPLPLIFKTIKESNGKIEFAEEIFSGIIVRICSEENEIEKYNNLDMNTFQLLFDDIRSNPLVVFAQTMPIKVDDEFKKLVARSLMGREEEIKTALQDAEAYAKKTFEKNLNICVNDAYETAYVDNMILDYEKKHILTNK